MVWAIGRSALLQRLRFFGRLFYRADHVERLLRQVIVLAVDNRFEAMNRLLERDVLAWRAGECFRHMEWLRQKALDFSRPRNDELVLGRELVHAEDGNDVTQFPVALQRLLHASGNGVMLRADNVRVELARGRVERINRRIDSQ
jgi:hypothetical protein